MYVTNISNYLHSLPHNSPIRSEILDVVSTCVPTRYVSMDFAFNERAVRYMRAKHTEILLHMNVAPGYSRPGISETQIKVAEDFANDIIPFTSGRDFRVCRYTQDKLYSLYLVYCNEHSVEGKDQMGKSSFIRHFLSKEKIRWSKDSTICVYCHDHDTISKINEADRTEKQREKYQKAEIHLQRWDQATRYYLKVKKELALGMREGTCIVVHDFTQIQVQSSFYQDLIICFYYHNPAEPDGLGRSYFHFVARSTDQKNDVNFVIAAWKKMAQEEFFNRFDSIYIFSDGGPKHFKVTGNLAFFAVLQQQLNKNITYCFFESNHGHSVCDAVAAQAKNQIENRQRNEGIRITNSAEIVENLNCIESHVAMMAPPNGQSPKFPTFNGIKGGYRFQFTETQILLFSSPYSKEPTKSFPRPPFNFFV